MGEGLTYPATLLISENGSSSNHGGKTESQTQQVLFPPSHCQLRDDICQDGSFNHLGQGLSGSLYCRPPGPHTNP